MIRCALVDAVLDTLGDDEGASGPLAALLDANDAWNWRRDENRAAVIESTGAWWCVFVASGRPTATRHPTSNDATARFDAVCGDLSSAPTINLTLRRAHPGGVIGWVATALLIVVALPFVTLGWLLGVVRLSARRVDKS